MADNTISILIEAKDAATRQLQTVSQSIEKLSKTSEESAGSFDRLSAKSAAMMGAIAGGAQVLVNKGINLITASVSDAISRVDTLNNSNRTFENMGFSAQVTKSMMHELDLSIRGLPTSLNDAVQGVELLTGSTNDIGQSRKIFDALNDGIIGFGGSAAQVNGAVIQLSQAFSNGRVDAQTWNSLIQNGMGPALNALARQMGLTIGQFKDGLSNGTISVAEFQKALIDLDTKGGGGMKSLNKIAHDATDGIGTGMANAKTAVARGIADIIQAIGTSNISHAISDVGKGFEGAAKSASSLGPVVKEVWGILDKLFGPSLEALFHTFEEKLLPSIQRYIPWLEFGAKVLGVTFYAATWLLINTLNVLANVLGYVGQVMGNVGQWFVDRYFNIVHLWQGIPGFFQGVVGGIHAAFANVTEWIFSPFKDAYTGIINLFKNLPGELGGIVKNAFGSVSNAAKSQLHNLHIPGFASGTNYAPGGLALVGERGPELVNLPRGSQVYPNQQSQQMLGGTTVNYNAPIYLQTAEATREFFKIQDRNSTLASMGMSVMRAA